MDELFYIRKRNQTTTILHNTLRNLNYFTSEKEIKPQLKKMNGIYGLIILHQKKKSNHNNMAK